MDSAIEWLIGSNVGVLILVTFAASWLLEKSAWWNNIQSQWKQLIVLAIAILLGVGLVGLKQNPGVMNAIRPYFDIAVAIVLAWFSMQFAHKTDKVVTTYTDSKKETGKVSDSTGPVG